MHHTEFVLTQIEYAGYFSVSEIVWTWPEIVKTTCRLLMRARIDDCHWRLNSITTSKKITTTTSQTYIDYTTYVDYRVLPRNVVIRPLNSTAQKRNRNYLPETWETQTALNGTEPDTNWVRNFPFRPLTWLKPKYFCPSDTHWHVYVEYGLRLLYYSILHWGRPVSKSRQIELTRRQESRTNMRRFWYVAISKIFNALIALFY